MRGDWAKTGTERLHLQYESSLFLSIVVRKEFGNIEKQGIHNNLSICLFLSKKNDWCRYCMAKCCLNLAQKIA